MPTKSASFKSLRQTKKHALRNKLAKLQIADARRAFRKATDKADSAKSAEAVKASIKLLDKAYSRGIMKLNTVSRLKSRLMKKHQKTATAKK
jgi:ribosomal protein S20